MANDDLAEVAALAETLRATIATLDQRIEQLAAERAPATLDHLLAQALERLRQAGEAWREEMSQRVPEAREFNESLPTSVWTATAAKLAADICDERAAQEKGE